MSEAWVVTNGLVRSLSLSATLQPFEVLTNKPFKFSPHFPCSMVLNFSLTMSSFFKQYLNPTEQNQYTIIGTSLQQDVA
jgi:hypothetical protein